MMKYSTIFKKQAKCHSRSILRSISICIVGAGPAGFYCAQNLLKILPSSVVDIYEKLPVPFGLVRFGVAPDHHEVKNVINNFNKVASSSRVRFIGNVNVGTDIKLDNLRNSYNAVVLSYGADQDVELGISGENLANVISARRFVGWYNGLPSDKDIPVNLDSENVTIIGHGNVAVDVARILLKSVDDLKKTDITEYALSKLSESKVKTVNLIGRRGPLQVAFTIKEFRELTKLPRTRVMIDSKFFDSALVSMLPELPRPRRRLTELLLNTAQQSENSNLSESSSKTDKTLRMMFMRTPVTFVGTGCVKQVELAINRYQASSVDLDLPVEDRKVESSGEKEFLATDLAFKSIGYRSSQIEPAIPFSASNCIGDARVLPGVYSAGWLSTGPSGVLLATMTNAFNTANLIAHDIENGSLDGNENKPGFEFIQSMLRKKGIATVDWQGWRKIDETEVLRGTKHGKPREKIVNVEEMLEIGGKPV